MQVMEGLQQQQLLQAAGGVDGLATLLQASSGKKGLAYMLHMLYQHELTAAADVEDTNRYVNSGHRCALCTYSLMSTIRWQITMCLSTCTSCPKPSSWIHRSSSGVSTVMTRPKPLTSSCHVNRSSSGVQKDYISPPIPLSF